MMYNMSMLHLGSQMNGGGGVLNYHPVLFCKSVYLIKKTGKAWNKKYESPPFVFVNKAYSST